MAVLADQQTTVEFRGVEYEARGIVADAGAAIPTEARIDGQQIWIPGRQGSRVPATIYLQLPDGRFRVFRRSS